MKNNKQEDAIMKMGFEFFRDTILKTLGIPYEFVSTGFTELVDLNIQTLYMDFTFLTTEDFYIHLEFQTTDKGISDLQRFHAYDAVYSHKTGKKVITYVIYSGGIKKTRAELDCGLYTYRVNPIYLQDKNADFVFRRLKEKQKNGEFLSEADFSNLCLTPLMSGNMSKKETIKEAMLLARQSSSAAAEKTTAMLYALADKFLDNEELEEIKEVVRMTRLGQMLLDEGMQYGKDAGRKNIILRMLSKKQYSYEEIADVAEITVEEVRRIEQESANENDSSMK
ncbi:MAG: hypothetical protein UFJ18_01835 [Blautia sp.]|nr:hypothetical protein [Blautia sp.]